MHIECPTCGAFFDEDENIHCPRCQTPADQPSACGGCRGGCSQGPCCIEKQKQS
ncbi:MAG: hypothetical protein GX375_01705 [Clostridiales bacterium]|nr:hypothetical protein [Clostridiales bacterium]